MLFGFMSTKPKNRRSQRIVAEIRSAVASGGRLTGKGREGTFWVDGNVPYPNMDGGYVDVSFFFFFFLAALQQIEFPGQESDLSCSCYPGCSCGNSGSLTQGFVDQTLVPALPKGRQSCCTTAGTPMWMCFFKLLNCALKICALLYESLSQQKERRT